jgi:hypothetical protein
MSSHHLLRSLLSACLLLPASAMAENFEVFGQIGTEGFGIGGAYHLTARQALRIEGNTGSISRDLDAGENSYDVSLEPETLGVFYDFYPSATSGFRLSLGVAAFNTEASGDVTGDTVEIDGVVYPLGPDDSLSIEVAPEQSAALYLGLGWGRSLGRDGRWGFFADLGAYFTSYEASIRASQSLKDQIDAALLAAGSSETADDVIAAEEQNVQDDVDDFRFYPVLKIGVSYKF